VVRLDVVERVDDADVVPVLNIFPSPAMVKYDFVVSCEEWKRADQTLLRHVQDGDRPCE
jgi:hypothetical protein